jgi:polyisoprenoid-binding protein YceI
LQSPYWRTHGFAPRQAVEKKWQRDVDFRKPRSSFRYQAGEAGSSQSLTRGTTPMTIHFKTPLGLRVVVAALVAATMGLPGGLSQAAESAGPAAVAPIAGPPAGAYKLDKAHASLVLRANHMGFSTYTTRFSRFDADLTLDPRNLSAARVVTTIDASSFEMDAAPQMCVDIMKGPQMLDTAKFPQIVFKSEKIRMTGAKSMEISGTLTLHGVTRPTVLVATYNGGYAGMPNLDPQARVGFSAHGSFKRSDFGIAYGVPAPGTTVGVGDSIDFSIEAEFTGPPLAAPAAQTH